MGLCEEVGEASCRKIPADIGPLKGLLKYCVKRGFDDGAVGDEDEEEEEDKEGTDSEKESEER